MSQDSVLKQQMDVLNHFYSPIGLNFAVAGVQRFAAPAPYMHGWNDPNVQRDMKKRFRRGNQQNLNIYTTGPVTSGPYAPPYVGSCFLCSLRSRAC
jgi:hypothetical protein